MSTTRKRTLGIEEVRKRAAQIRQRWSPLEKVQRTGLPPDMPLRLRQHLFGVPEHVWCTAPVSRGPRQ